MYKESIDLSRGQKSNHRGVMHSRSASFLPRQAITNVSYSTVHSSYIPHIIRLRFSTAALRVSRYFIAQEPWFELTRPLSNHMIQNARFRSISIYFNGVSIFSSSFSKSFSMISFSVIFGVRCKCSTSPPLSCHSMSLLNAPSVFEASS